MNMCVNVYVHDFPACLKKSKKKTAVPLLEQRAVNLREMICARARSCFLSPWKLH